MTVETLDSIAPARGNAASLLATLSESSRAWQSTVERLRTLRRLPAKPGGCVLHETIAAARPALVAALQRALGGTILVVVPTPDAAERIFADLLYYLAERVIRSRCCVRARRRSARSKARPSAAPESRFWTTSHGARRASSWRRSSPSASI